MKADPADELETPGATLPSETRADPFATDLFAASRERSASSQGAPTAGDSSARAERSSNDDSQGRAAEVAARIRPAWHASLPRLSRLEARFSKTLAALPPALSSRAIAAVARALARLAHAAPHDVTFETVGLREINFGEWSEARSAEDAPRVFALVAVEPEGSHVVVETDAGFAAALTGRMLGDDADTAETLRALSKTERAIIEFLCLSLIRELNETAGEPLFRLAAVADDAPAFLAAKAPATNQQAHARVSSQLRERNTRGVSMSVRVRIGTSAGLVRLVFDAASLAALDAQQNPLLSDGRGAKDDRLARYRKLAGQVALRLLLGETEVDAPNLAELESGDVVIVERPFVEWRAGEFAGEARLRVGGGSSVIIAGEIQTLTVTGGVISAAREFAQGGGERGRLGLAVQAVYAQEYADEDAERLSMEEEDPRNGDGEAEGEGVLDSLLLTIRVELAARRLTLDELARLRTGQILELGCRATDPVELVADGRPVASGELVDIDGQLGVRVTRLLS
jgi:type III secretion system YscQ/HrcQ family protein